MPRKTIKHEELEKTDEIQEIKEELTQEPVKLEKKRKPYKVVLVTEKIVVIESPPGCGASIDNIWGTELKTGDTVYLEEG